LDNLRVADDIENRRDQCAQMNDDELGCHMCRLSVIQPYDRADWRCAGLYIHNYPEGGSIKRVDSQKAQGVSFFL